MRVILGSASACVNTYTCVCKYVYMCIEALGCRLHGAGGAPTKAQVFVSGGVECLKVWGPGFPRPAEAKKFEPFFPPQKEPFSPKTSILQREWGRGAGRGGEIRML